MKSIIKLLAVFVLLLATFGQHTTASADGAQVFYAKGPSAFAQFSTDSGCIHTAVFVFAADRRIRAAPGPTTSESFASVTILQSNSCENELLLNASGSTFPLSNEEFQISPQLDSATLNTTITLFDTVSETTFQVDVNMTWVGTGPLTRENSNDHFRESGCIINTRLAGKSRPAEASGTVSDGTTNFTPEPSVFARLSSLMFGRVAINCPEEE
jgi:hypothetical protein